MIKLSYLSAIRFSGADAGSFLHNQLSADILGLASGEATFACYCEPKGRVLALMLVRKAADDYLVIMSSELAAEVTRRLLIYRLRSKVDIEILNDAVLGITAGSIPELTAATTVALPGGKQWLSVGAADMSAVTDKSLQAAWKFAELQLGICWLDNSSSGQFLPQMLGFEQLGAVNYRKGCYPGQEIVARTHYLGKVKRHPRLLECMLSTGPQPMEKINILAEGLKHEAVVADCAAGGDGRVRLLAVTRMEPGLPAEMIEYGDETVALI
ncbi:MAG: hypothetical protein WBS20_04115 [Lysobacterales bacterium]